MLVTTTSHWRTKEDRGEPPCYQERSLQSIVGLDYKILRKGWGRAERHTQVRGGDKAGVINDSS